MEGEYWNRVWRGMEERKCIEYDEKERRRKGKSMARSGKE
jgi:hypothetical protein